MTSLYKEFIFDLEECEMDIDNYEPDLDGMAYNLIRILKDIEAYTVGEYDYEKSEAAFNLFRVILADIEDADCQTYLEDISDKSKGLTRILSSLMLWRIDEYHRLAEKLSLAVQQSQLLNSTSGRSYSSGGMATL